MMPAAFRRRSAYWLSEWGEDHRLEGGAEADLYGAWGKRAFDIVASLVMLVLVLPLIAVLMLLAAADGGPPIFAHSRVGRGGRSFRCLKIRTMVVDAEARLAQILAEDPRAAAEWRHGFKLQRDSRVTALGRILRRTSLDELPQLWNVLRGDMSLVGPRPVTAEEFLCYGPSADRYTAMRPGLTGLWQVSGRNEVSFAERVAFDCEYAERISLRADLSILLRTVPAVLRVTGR